MTLREYDFEKEPVVSIVKKILTDAINMKASDIHFDPTSTELSIKFRINGTLQEYTIAPESVKSNITTRIKILANMNITDSMHPQTGTINFESEGKHHDMRASSLPVCDGEKLVLSIHNYENTIKSLSKMGLSPIDTEKIKKLVKSNQGLVLITGTSSSGKTTTMYAMLKEIQSKSLNIISIEDPVKLKIDGINQVEISPDKGITYKNALKHIMLQDPNIICIDNLIDDEIAREAIRASITGRLVISSIYTKNAYTTIDNLLNMDIENYLLGSNLNGIISQRLVKQLCPKCKEKRYTTEYEKTILKMLLNQDINELYYPKGCEECHNGYIGQIPIVEVVEIDDEIKNAITNKKDRKIIKELLYKDNTPIIINGFNKVLEGITSFNEIIRITDVKIDLNDNQNDIREYILGNSTPTIKENVETATTQESSQNVEEIQTIIPTNINEEITQTEETPVENNRVIEQPITEEVTVVEEQPQIEENIIEENTIIEEVPVEETQIEEQPMTEEVTVVEEPAIQENPVVEENIVQEEQQIEEQPTEEGIVQTVEQEEIEPTQQIQMPTEGQRLIDEVSELIGEDFEEFNILAEILNDNLNEEQTTEKNIQPETTAELEVQEETPVEENEPVVENPNIDEQQNIEEPIIENQTQIEEVQQTVEQPEITEQHAEEEQTTIEEAAIQEEQPITDEQTVEENIVQQEINVPTPMEANIVEEKPTPIDDDDDDDEDDFGYGEDYENSF